MLKKSVALFVVGIAFTVLLAYIMHRMGLLINIFDMKNRLNNPENTVINNTSEAEEETEEDFTILDADDDSVPLTTQSGDTVQFSDSDIVKLTQMFEVPYLYTESFENANGVPIAVACHAAVWQAQQKAPGETDFSQGVITVYLFKYFGGTVPDFKESCNAVENTPITYDESAKTFHIVFSESAATHSIEIEKIEDLGNNNYYKVTAAVAAENASGCPYTVLTAVIQKNRLDTDLGFSIKAMQWK